MGIHSEELRIGNLIAVEDTHLKELWDWAEIHLKINVNEICHIDKDEVRMLLNSDWTEEVEFNYEDVDPIPLTEEWLAKFGFDAPKTPLETFDKHKLSIHFPSETYTSGRIYFNSWFIVDMDRLKYVHQLQNLFFALTGEELQLSQG